jgi:hypothetical protein
MTACVTGYEGHRIEAARLALHFGPHAQLPNRYGGA